MNTEQVRQAYASVAEIYIELFGSSQQVHAEDLAFIRRHLAGRPGPVLDLGCGPGHITGYLCSLGIDATGIDMVPGSSPMRRRPTRAVGTDSGRWKTAPLPATRSPASLLGTR